jgi:hypothetical protein
MDPACPPSAPFIIGVCALQCLLGVFENKVHLEGIFQRLLRTHALSMVVGYAIPLLGTNHDSIFNGATTTQDK